jgi:hypothetical protein
VAGPKKKYKQCGAPLYMSQFTMIMLILIVMCMLMSVMSKEQDSGFKEGDGMGPERNPNAMGIVIGSGAFKFGAAGRARTYSSNPGAQETETPQNPHMDILKGQGGVGNTDMDAKVMPKPKYFIYKLGADFPPKSSVVTPGIAKAVEMLSTGLGYFDFDLTLKVFSNELNDETKDTQLAFDRGMKIISALNKKYGIPLHVMSCVAYTGKKLFADEVGSTAEAVKEGQDIVVCLRLK